uniref:Uncharacterized protein n=1 Tax=Bionectria ochroleuca TaxID=29856 RepID=A0A8H7TQF7_BIOOC
MHLACAKRQLGVPHSQPAHTHTHTHTHTRSHPTAGRSSTGLTATVGWARFSVCMCEEGSASRVTTDGCKRRRCRAAQPEAKAGQGGLYPVQQAAPPPPPPSDGRNQTKRAQLESNKRSPKAQQKNQALRVIRRACWHCDCTSSAAPVPTSHIPP